MLYQGLIQVEEDVFIEREKVSTINVIEFSGGTKGEKAPNLAQNLHKEISSCLRFRTQNCSLAWNANFGLE